MRRERRILAAALAAALALSGCSALLERSYSMVEPYADRYWDSGAEDTLKVESYQDLVNSLMMLIEQRAEEAVIRCYDEAGSYQEAARARSEVRWDTMRGAYLLQNIRFTFEEGASYSTVTFQMSYREDAEDLDSVMTLSDSQSLVDLLRLAVREDHERITARFTFDTPRESVRAAVESYWQELCRDEMDAAVPADGDAAVPPPEGALLPEGYPADDLEEEPEEAPEDGPEEEPAEKPEEMPEAPPEDQPEDGGEPAEPVSGTPGDGEEPDPIEYPPCPWVVRFYPNQETAELVEILLRTP